jgi:hypothetical protein
MWFRHRAWIPVAWVLSVLNVGAAWFAARDAEAWHATAHALLAVVFAVVAQRLHARLGRQAMPDALMVERLRELEARFAEFDELHDVDGKLGELAERLDFAERSLIDARAREPLPPKA